MNLARRLGPSRRKRGCSGLRDRKPGPQGCCWLGDRRKADAGGRLDRVGRRRGFFHPGSRPNRLRLRRAFLGEQRLGSQGAEDTPPKFGGVPDRHGSSGGNERRRSSRDDRFPVGEGCGATRPRALLNLAENARRRGPVGHNDLRKVQIARSGWAFGEAITLSRSA